MRRAGGRVLLAGIRDRGTLYAVYAFLETLGARWFAPAFDFYGTAGGEYVPRNKSASVDALDVIEKPAMQWRKKYIEEGLSHTPANLRQLVDWMAKARLNVLNCPIDYGSRGRVRWDNWRDALIPELKLRDMLVEVGGHGYPNFLSPDKYFESHPEWFAMFGGRRIRAKNAVFSTANPEAVRTFIANVVEYLTRHPEIDIFDAWPPDGARWSEAPEDVALGTPSERHMRLLTQLADALHKQLPKVRVQFIAYASYLEPSHTRPQPDLLMDFCPINRSFETAIDDQSSQQNAIYFQALREWLKGHVAPDQVTIYSYITKYAWRSLPVLIPHMIVQEARLFAGLGIGGFATYSEPGAWATFELNHYIAARAIWNPSMDIAAELQDYTRARYGKAAEPVAQYLALVEQTVPHAIAIPGTDLELPRQRALVASFAKAKQILARAQTLTEGTAQRPLIEKLEAARQYADNEMRFRLMTLSNAWRYREYDALEKLLAERRALLEANRNTGVIVVPSNQEP